MKFSKVPDISFPCKKKRLLVPLLAVFLFLLSTPQNAKAQGGARVVQLSGFVALGDSLYGVAAVSVYVPGTNRGTFTNEYGFFSLPVLAGDSIVFSGLGYKEQYLKIPKTYTSQSYSIIMQMQEEATELPMVEVFPWPTERDFRQAVLDVKLPDKGRSNAAKNLDPELLAELFRITPMDAGANFNVWSQQQVRGIEQQNMVPSVSPFAVLKLLDMIRKGEFKKKD